MKNTNQVFWDWAAQENPYHYIATRRKDWTAGDFLRDGEWRVHKWVLPWLLAAGIDLKRATFLEVGCGAGRFGIHISKYVKTYIGVDISKQNIELFKNHLDSDDAKNVELIVGDGCSLKELADRSVDIVFSYAVLQHVWEKEVILSYLRDSVRVLKESGMAKHHLAGSNRTSGFGMRYLRVQTLGDRQWASRFLKSALPGDFLIPIPRRFHAGKGLEGEGIPYKKAIAYMASLGMSVKVEPFEQHNLASRYWLLFAKGFPQDLDGAYVQ